ncbi:MAG TPA: MFS transporter [Drouetiella sp.]
MPASREARTILSVQLENPEESLEASEGKSCKGGGNYRYVILGLAFLITLVNYMDRASISYAIGPIKKEFGIDDSQFGVVLAAFGVGYAVMTLGGGIIVDRWGARKVWPAAAIAWSGFTALMGCVVGFPALLSLRIMLGLSEGPHFPALTRVVADWLPQTERVRATGLGLCAVPLASAIGAPLISTLIITVGWKAMFLVMASAGIVWAGIWYIMFRDYPDSSTFVSESELRHIHEGQTHDRSITDEERRARNRNDGGTTWRDMLTNPALISNNIAYFAFGYSLFFALTWLPGYLEHSHNVKLEDARFILIAPWLTAAILLPVAGFLSDWLWIKTGSKQVSRSYLICICQLISGLSYVPLLFNPPLATSMLFISLGVGFGMMPNAAFYAINCDLAKDRAATSQGLMNCCSAIASIMAPALTGFIAARTNSFAGAFALLIFFTLVSVISVGLVQRLDSKAAP